MGLIFSGYRRKACSFSCPSQGCLISPGLSEPRDSPGCCKIQFQPSEHFSDSKKKNVCCPLTPLSCSGPQACVFPLFWEREGRKTGLKQWDWSSQQHSVSPFGSSGTEGLCCGKSCWRPSAVCQKGLSMLRTLLRACPSSSCCSCELLLLPWSSAAVKSPQPGFPEVPAAGCGHLFVQSPFPPGL